MDKPTKNSSLADHGRWKLARALVELTCSHVFQASIIMRLPRVEQKLPFVMGVDGINLYVDPEKVASFSVPEVAFILAHEAMHVAGLHPLRRFQRDPVSWNLAADAVVNYQGKEAGLTMPKECVPPVANETPEHLYESINPQVQKLREQFQDKMDKLESKLRAQYGDRFDELMEPKGKDGGKLSEAERQQLEQETKQWVEAAAVAARRAGHMTAGIERLCKEVLRSVQPWREVLARFVSEKRMSDYSWARPNRRYTPFNLYLPKLEARDIPCVCVAPDMSGSISPKMAERVVAEVIAVLDMMSGGEPIDVPILWFDAAVYPQIVSDASELKPRGGGGTDYAPVMKWVTKHHGEYDFKGCVVVTDGECGSFGTQPPCEVLWVLTQDNDKFTPPFGEVALVLNEPNV